MLRLAAALLLISTTAAAQAFVSAVADANGLSAAQAARAQRAAESALKQLSALSVGEGPAWTPGAPRRCDDDCARQRVNSLSAPGVALLTLRALDKRGEQVAFDLAFWLEGEKLGEKSGQGQLDALEKAMKPAVQALLPPWARKGWGGLRLDVEGQAVVKVEGRVSEARPGEVVPLPAGSHRVDVIFADGSAVLQRVDLPEGARGRLQVSPPGAAVSTRATVGASPLRLTSYGLFVAGAAVVAGGLVAGALSRGTSVGMAPCREDARDCATLDAALAANNQAQAYGTTGNVMLGVGGGLALTGAGLFLFDVVTAR